MRSLLRHAPVACAWLAAAATAGCTVDGGPQQCPSQQRPSARSAFTPVTVGATNQIYALGGESGTRAIDQLWRWSFGSCGGWQSLTLASTPGPRTAYAAAFDELRHRILYVGGAARNDVWALDTDALTFTLLQTVGSPPLVAAAELAAYDADHDRLILVGIDTYELDFAGSAQGEWRVVSGDSATAPASGALDPTRSLFLVLDAKGMHGFSFLTSTWREISIGGETPTAGAQLAWDAARMRLIAVADAVWSVALDANGSASTFTRLVTNGDPPPRSDFGATVSGDLVWLFGGAAHGCTYDDLWELDLPSGAWKNVWPATSCQ